jgi:hypothetical protein
LGVAQTEGTRPSFYALAAGGWRDYVTLLHPPYTAWLLAYVVMGAAAAPEVRWDRLGYALGAFFLAVGVAAHAFDELRGRPLRTSVPAPVLGLLAGGGLLGALALGIYGTIVISPWLWAFIAFGMFIVPAYNLEWFGGRFHTDFWFAAAWGAFPFGCTYWAMGEDFSIGAGILTVFCLATGLLQRRLSTHVRSVRRRAAAVSGEVRYRDGSVAPVSSDSLIEAPEAALKLAAMAMVLLAAGWIATRV